MVPFPQQVTYLVHQRTKNVSLTYNLVSRLIWICRVHWWCLFMLMTRNTLLGEISSKKFGSKSQKCWFNLKFDTYTNFNVYNLMVAFAFSVLDWKYLFWTNWVSKFKIVSLSWNLVPTRIWACRIQWCSLLLFLTINTLPMANLVQKIKTVTVSWNLLPTLFWICRIQWCCSLFSLAFEFLFRKSI